jgi:small GTP-binding protein
MEETQEKNDKPLKIAILGYNKVGKSSLISALTKNKTNVIFKQTKDIEKYSEEIKIEEKNYKLDILDTIYKETLANYEDKYFGDIDKSEGYILIYSIDEIKTYEIAKVIYKEIIKINKNVLKADIIGESSIIFVGNKNDLKVENDFSKEVKEFCSDNKIKHIQTNTLDGNNVKEVFESVVKGILYNRQNRKNDLEEKFEEFEEEEEEEEDDDEEEGNIEKGGLDLGKLLEELQGKKEENNENKEKEIKEKDSIEKEKNEEKSNKIEKKEEEEKEEEEKNEIKGDCGCCILF